MNVDVDRNTCEITECGVKSVFLYRTLIGIGKAGMLFTLDSKTRTTSNRLNDAFRGESLEVCEAELIRIREAWYAEHFRQKMEQK